MNKTEEVDVDGWNKEETDYCFAYIPEGEDQVRVLVLCVYLGSKLCIQALAKKIGKRIFSSYLCFVSFSFGQPLRAFV